MCYLLSYFKVNIFSKKCYIFKFKYKFAFNYNKISFIDDYNIQISKFIILLCKLLN